MSVPPRRFDVIDGGCDTSDSPTITVIGSGVVGTATGLGFAARGADVTFCDISPERVSLLRRQGLDAIDAKTLSTHFTDAYLLSVPTPTVDGHVDLTYLVNAATTLGHTLAAHPGRPLVVVRSTVPPGTTQNLVIPVLEQVSGRTAGPGFSVGMNPEFLRAAKAVEDFDRPRVIVIGALDYVSESALRRLYLPWADVPTVALDLTTAEATKYVSNLFNATKISFFNEMHTALERIGADPTRAFEVVAAGAEGMWNPTYGTRGKAPYGGVCLPKDTVGFLGFAEDEGFADEMKMLTATIAVNDRLRAEGSVERVFDPAPLHAEELAEQFLISTADQL